LTPLPVQFSETSQLPALGRHTVVVGSRTSAGQAAPAPLQCSATSHAPADTRQIVDVD